MRSRVTRSVQLYNNGLGLGFMFWYGEHGKPEWQASMICYMLRMHGDCRIAAGMVRRWFSQRLHLASWERPSAL